MQAFPKVPERLETLEKGQLTLAEFNSFVADEIKFNHRMFVIVLFCVLLLAYGIAKLKES